MPFFRINPARSIRGKILLPGDKSIAHRSIIISAIAKGKTYIHNFPTSRDCLTTLDAFKKLGVRISKTRIFKTGKINPYINLYVKGGGLYSLSKPSSKIIVRESGTTTRLILGVLAGQQFSTTLTTATNLINRPMMRITEPLRRMGAIIKANRVREYNKSKTQKYIIQEYLPITIKGGCLNSIRYKMPIASAQVKSSLLLAGLYAKGATIIYEPIKTRDHTERMLRDFNAAIKVRGEIITLHGQKELISPGRIDIPGDISSASFFAVAAILLPSSNLLIKSVSLNSTRLGLIRVLKRMGANIKISITQYSSCGPIGNIIVKGSNLKATKVRSGEVPQLIDELPILMLAACFAKGRTTINGIEELRVKETDRINSMQANLKKMGAQINVASYRSKSGRLKEKIIIKGKRKLKGARVNSFRDHRTAMSMIIAGLVSSGQTIIDDIECIDKSFPSFLRVLKSLIR